MCYSESVTFEVWIDILQIHYENDERTGGKAKESKVKLYSNLTFEWKVNKALLDEVKTLRELLNESGFEITDSEI